jgi:hypothetical protein
MLEILTLWVNLGEIRRSRCLVSFLRSWGIWSTWCGRAIVAAAGQLDECCA